MSYNLFYHYFLRCIFINLLTWVYFFVSLPSRPVLLPILEPEYVVAKIVDAILQEKVYLYVPRIIYLLMVLKR